MSNDSMDPQRYQRLKALFAQLVSLAEEERERVLLREVPGDERLRLALRQLLASAKETHEDGLAALAATFTRGGSGETGSAGEVSLPQRFGRYQILHKLGMGGMGVVFEAQQENPNRRVALKVVNAGVLSEQSLRRFELEAQVLGKLQHPGIAQIFEADKVDTGVGLQPFFAMECIDGRDLLDFAEVHKLSPRERLDLIAKVCDAVQHAHQRGVIHRDLKPGNILVTSEGQPKVLDFGVARVTDSDLQAATLQTDAGQLVGTVPYMSPEQASGERDALDTRSDVYALGVIAYQMLSGSMPYDLEGLLIHEALRVVREDEPSRLGTKRHDLRGEVEILVGKALEKNPSRRYQSAAAFAEDIRRFLNHEPITARPASALYQLRKFARRNRALVSGVVAAFLTLIIGLAGTLWGLIEADQKRRLAEDEAARAQQTATFLTEILDGVRPAVALGRDTRLLKDILDDTAERIETELSGYQRVEAQIRSSLGMAYFAISEYQDSLLHHRRSADLLAEVEGPTSEESLTEQIVVASLLEDVGQVREAESELWRLIELCRELYGAEHPLTDQAEHHLGVIYRVLEMDQRADDLLTRGLYFRRHHYGNEHEQTLIAIHQLGLLRLNQRLFEESDLLLQEYLETSRRVLGESHPYSIGAVHGLAGLYKEQSRWEEAERLFLEVAQRHRVILGAEHVVTVQSIKSLGMLYHVWTRYEDAADLLEQVLEFERRELGADHLETLDTEDDLGEVYRGLGRIDEAIALHRHAYEAHRIRHGTDSVMTQIALANLATSYEKDEDHRAEARQIIDQLAESLPRVLGPEHQLTLTVHNNLAIDLSEEGRWGEAEALVRRTLEVRMRILGPNHVETLRSQYTLAHVLTKSGQHHQAVEPLCEFLPRWIELFGDDNRFSVRGAQWLQQCLDRLPRVGGPSAGFRALLEFHRRCDAEVHTLAGDLRGLADALVSEGDWEAAQEVAEEALDLLAESDYSTGVPMARVLLVLADALCGQELQEDAEPLYLECWDLWSVDPQFGPEVAGRLEAMYSSLGEEEEAREWQRRARPVGGS